jgi:branched-chain amino acid aminotransferase
MKVIYNGALVDLKDSQCDDKGWMKGSGVFETIKTVDNSPWVLSRHMRRAVTSSRQLGFSIASEDDVRAGVALLCKTEKFPNGLLRISFGNDGDWSAVHLPYTPIHQPASLAILSSQISVAGQPVKSYPYTHRLDILNSVKALGFDEAIIINEFGRVSEGSVTNLIFKIDRKWLTPPISDGVLAGVMRALVVEYCGVAVKSIELADLSRVESAFLLSSLRIAQPVLSIDGRLLEQSPEFGAEIEAMALRTSVG